MYATDVIFDDSNFEQMANIKPTAFHREVDLAVCEADEKGMRCFFEIARFIQLELRLAQDTAGRTSSCQALSMAYQKTRWSMLASKISILYQSLHWSKLLLTEVGLVWSARAPPFGYAFILTTVSALSLVLSVAIYDYIRR